MLDLRRQSDCRIWVPVAVALHNFTHFDDMCGMSQLDIRTHTWTDALRFNTYKPRFIPSKQKSSHCMRQVLNVITYLHMTHAAQTHENGRGLLDPTISARHDDMFCVHMYIWLWVLTLTLTTKFSICQSALHFYANVSQFSCQLNDNRVLSIYRCLLAKALSRLRCRKHARNVNIYDDILWEAEN